MANYFCYCADGRKQYVETLSHVFCEIGGLQYIQFAGGQADCSAVSESQGGGRKCFDYVWLIPVYFFFLILFLFPMGWIICVINKTRIWTNIP